MHRFLSLRFRAALALRGVAVGLIDRGWPGVRATVVTRTRLIDELVLASVDDVDQVVILGAGFDTRAYRLPALRALPVVEVDHPDTQRLKRARLGPPPDNVRFAPTNFQLDTLGPAPTVRTLFLWEGVTNYLTETAADFRRRYLGPPADEIRGHEFYRVAHARVG